jgi:hypothetical protein
VEVVSLTGRHSYQHRLSQRTCSSRDDTSELGPTRTDEAALTRKTLWDLEAVDLAERYAGVLCLTAGESTG